MAGGCVIGNNFGLLVKRVVEGPASIGKAVMTVRNHVSGTPPKPRSGERMTFGKSDGDAVGGKPLVCLARVARKK